jgi:hypothetical protein
MEFKAVLPHTHTHKMSKRNFLLTPQVKEKAKVNLAERLLAPVVSGTQTME